MSEIDRVRSFDGELGEKLLFEKIKDNCRVVFDVGCRDSGFTNLTGIDVHYFDPVQEFIDKLKSTETNTSAHFNVFGLSDESGTQPYYSTPQTFVDRCISKTHPAHCHGTFQTEPDKILELHRGDEYMEKNGVTKIDFLKIYLR